jgi:mono/diheme cytochrome c family protein
MKSRPSAFNQARMKTEKVNARRLSWSASIAAALAVAAVICVAAGCATSPEHEQSMSPPGQAASQTNGLAAEQGVRTGAELYAVNCNRCHAERSPMERNASDWKTILTHMRVRANLPAAQANAILEYLQANSGE